MVVVTKKNGVTTIRMNDPKKLNSWSLPMFYALKNTFEDLKSDPETKVVVLTGTDPYYCAGVNLSGTIKPMHPRALRDDIYERTRVIIKYISITS